MIADSNYIQGTDSDGAFVLAQTYTLGSQTAEKCDGKANTDYIVHCVNTHEKLCAVAEDYVSFIHYEYGQEEANKILERLEKLCE